MHNLAEAEGGTCPIVPEPGDATVTKKVKFAQGKLEQLRYLHIHIHCIALFTLLPYHANCKNVTSHIVHTHVVHFITLFFTGLMTKSTHDLSTIGNQLTEGHFQPLHEGIQGYVC